MCIWGECGGNVCMYIRDCLKWSFSIFLSWLCHKLKFLIPMADLCPPSIVVSKVMSMCVNSNVQWSCCMLAFIMCMLLLIPLLFLIYWLPCGIFSVLSSPQVRTGTIYIDKASKCRKKIEIFMDTSMYDCLCILIHSNTRAEVCFVEVHSNYRGVYCWTC